MALEYKLVPDPENPGQYKAEIVNQKVFTQDDIIDKMMKSERLKHLSREEVRKNYEAIHAYIELIRIEGKTLETPLFKVSDGKITPGVVLQEIAENIEIKKVNDDS